jgi:hypothetical protein
MTSRLVVFTVTFLSAAGCSTVPQIRKPDYAQAIVGSWQYTATHSGESIQKDLIVVFHSGGRTGIRTRAPYGFGPEVLIDERWRIDGDRLVTTETDSRTRTKLARTYRIISFTDDEIVTISEYIGTDKINAISQATQTYTRVQQQRDTPNQTMQRTPTRRSRSNSHD